MLVAALLPLPAARAFSSDNSSFARSFSQGLILTNAPVVVTVTFTNLETNTLRGFFFSDEVPTGTTVSTLSVALNGRNIRNYTLESGLDGDVYAGYTPWRWILERPAGFAESNPIPPQAGVRIVYAVASSVPGSFSFPQFFWTGQSPPNTNAAFGYSEAADQQTVVVPGASAREYITNGTFETWTSTNTFLGWTEMDPTKVTTNSIPISGQYSACLLAASGSADFRQPLDLGGQGMAPWIFNADFACSQPTGSVKSAFGICLQHASLPATNGLNLRVVDVDSNGMGEVQLFDSTITNWVTVLTNAVTFTTDFTTFPGLRTNHLQLVGWYNQAVPSYDLSIVNSSGVASSALSRTSYQVAPPGNGSPIYLVDFVQNTYATGTTAVVDNVSFTLLSPAVQVTPNGTNVDCGNLLVAAATATGPGPFGYQWFAPNSNAISGATGATLTLPNPQAGTYTVVGSNSFGLASARCLVTTADTTPPVLVLNGVTPIAVECHSVFIDPGCIASDNCSSIVLLTTNNSVKPNVPGDYALEYVATDAAGNSATNTRLVHVVDTTAPAVSTSATNQNLTAGYDGTATLPDLTGFLVATDACSLVLNFLQVPPPGTRLGLGSNTVHFFVDDGNGNTNTADTQVMVNAPALLPPVIAAPGLDENGRFQLSFSGLPGQPYRLLAATNAVLPMTAWSVLTNGTVGDTAVPYTDDSSPTNPARFFRIASP